MAETDKHSRTEDATPRKRERARGEGRVAKSTDLIFGLMLVASAGLLLLAGPLVRDGFLELLHRVLGGLRAVDGEQLVALGVDTMTTSVLVSLPLLLGILPIALAASFGQIGVHLHPEKLRFKLEKVAPNLTPGRFVNVRSLVETLTSVLKLALLAAAAWFAVFADATRVLDAGDTADIGAHAVDLIVRLLLALGVTLIAIGLLDLALKRKALSEELRMTKEEVRQEMKDAVGDPEVRGRIRRQQRELALRRMMDAVPDASVVVTNPTHFAVALSYHDGEPAPLCVAKGQDFVALKIRELAEAAGVPLVENPPLARTLFGAVEVGQEIPPELYQAVAEVLASVFRTRSRLGRTA